MKAEIESRLIDVSTVAKLLGFTVRTVYRHADAGIMPRPIKLGGAVRWDKRVLEKWIDEGFPNLSVTHKRTR